MIINFRYHIFTITAIFAALGLGILIGSSIVGNEGLFEEQKRIVKNISDDISNLKRENKELLVGLNSLEQELLKKKNIEEELYPLLLKDFMKNRKFFLFYKNITKDKIDDIYYYFELMGAKFDVLDYTTLKNNNSEGNYDSYNHFISWNIENDLESILMELKIKPETEDFSIINYQGDSVEGLIFNIIKDVI